MSDGRGGMPPREAERSSRLVPRHWSLRTRLVVSSIATLMLVLVFLGVIVRLSVRAIMMAAIERRLQEEVHSSPMPLHFASDGPGRTRPGDGPPSQERPPDHFRQDGDNGPPGPPHFNGLDIRRDNDENAPGASSPREERTASATLPAKLGTIYSVRHFDLAGKPIGVRPLLDAEAFARAKAGTGKEIHSTLPINGELVEVLTVPYRHEGQVAGVVQAGYPLTEVNETLNSLDVALLLLIPIGLLAAGASGIYLTSRVLRTVHQTTRAAERIGFHAEHGLSERLPVVGNDEFAQLAATFNALLGRVEETLNEQKRLVEQQRRFTADASHELKTPLTVIRGMTNLALSGAGASIDPRLALERIDSASAGMTHLVQDLLLLARSDSGQLAGAQIELLISDVLKQACLRTLPPTTALHLQLGEEPLTVRGNEGELVRVFSNLLDNAARYSAADEMVEITASVERDGSTVVAKIADRGIGIAPEHLKHLGERFYRVDSSRARSEGGTGLGLSICRGIVEAHGGTLTFASVPGHGTTVTVRLPLAER